MAPGRLGQGAVGADGGYGLYADSVVEPMVKAFFATHLK